MHDNSVNIFHKHICYVTTSLSTCCKTYCFAFQKRLFCAAKPTLLPCKRAAFATSKRSYHFLTELSLQNQSHFFVKPLYVYCEYADMLLWRDLSRSSYPHCSFRCWERDKLYPYTYKKLFFRVS